MLTKEDLIRPSCVRFNIRQSTVRTYLFLLTQSVTCKYISLDNNNTYVAVSERLDNTTFVHEVLRNLTRTVGTMLIHEVLRNHTRTVGMTLVHKVLRNYMRTVGMTKILLY